MLNIVKLQIAGAFGSKSVLFRGILDEVKTYNEMISSPKQARIEQLMRVCRTAGWYVTSKPPQPKSKNQRRWEAVRVLLEEAYTEAGSIGVKLLSGPTDFKTISGAHINQSYWLEFLDPQHRPGYQLSGQFSSWLTNGAAIAGKQSFWELIGTNFNPSSVDVLVKYYPEDPYYAAADHQLHFSGNRLCDVNGDRYSTRTKCTHLSGDGWAIFVVSPDGKLYSGSHEVGKHHHSSFLGGGAVMAAGEIVVDDGIVRVITAKSGHYRPNADNLRDMASFFGAIPGASIIQPDLAASQPTFHRVAEFRTRGTAAPALRQSEVLSQLPPFARSRSNPGWTGGFKTTFDRIPA